MLNFYEEKNMQILESMIDEGASVLFIYPQNLNFIKQIIEKKKLNVTLMYSQIEDLNNASDAGFKVINGNINRDIISMKAKEYNFVVVDEVIGSARFLGDTLKNFAKIGNNVILGNVNIANWYNRFLFFIYGSFFVTNPFNKTKAKVMWYDSDPWQLSSKDVINLCICNDLYIKKGFFYTKSGKIGSIFSISAYPNWSAFKAYYLITDETYVDMIKNYTMNPAGI
jgi:hypothetical protein